MKEKFSWLLEVSKNLSLAFTIFFLFLLFSDKIKSAFIHVLGGSNKVYQKLEPRVAPEETPKEEIFTTFSDVNKDKISLSYVHKKYSRTDNIRNIKVNPDSISFVKTKRNSSHPEAVVYYLNGDSTETNMKIGAIEKGLKRLSNNFIFDKSHLINLKQVDTIYSKNIGKDQAKPSNNYKKFARIKEYNRIFKIKNNSYKIAKEFIGQK